MSKKEIKKLDSKAEPKLEDIIKNQTPRANAGTELGRQLLIAFKNNIIKN